MMFQGCHRIAIADPSGHSLLTRSILYVFYLFISYGSFFKPHTDNTEMHRKLLYYSLLR